VPHLSFANLGHLGVVDREVARRGRRLPWFPLNTGTPNTPGLAWRAHPHSEIAGLTTNSASSRDFATSRASFLAH
jgi:hypothetical protein